MSIRKNIRKMSFTKLLISFFFFFTAIDGKKSFLFYFLPRSSVDNKKIDPSFKYVLPLVGGGEAINNCSFLTTLNAEGHPVHEEAACCIRVADFNGRPALSNNNLSSELHIGPGLET